MKIIAIANQRLGMGKTTCTMNIAAGLTQSEVFSSGKTIFEYKPDSQGAESYLALCNEIVERG